MAMERFRAQIMQEDQGGVYRTLGGNINSTASGSAPTSSTGFGTSEASEVDHYGHPDNYPIGTIFTSRKACYDAKVHRHIMKGIVGTVQEGAFSVVANDAYEDDIDHGDIIYYTGAGGRGNNFGGFEPQNSDQSFDHHDNRALLRNTETHHPVRVIRGSKDAKWGPLNGFRYDGLYDVVGAEYDKGNSGYRICRFKLQRRPGQTPLQNLPRQ